MNEQGPPGVSAPIQFDQVELPGAAKAFVQLCAVCRQQISETYYTVGASVLCPACSDKLTGRAAGATAFPRALLYGGVTALGGTIAWFLLVKMMQGTSWGIMGIVLGYLVGRAVREGSGGRGGWRYQALAMILTYSSICAGGVLFTLESIEQSGPRVVFALFGWALTAPVRAGASNIMGLIIIAIALYEAWKLNKRIPVSGPFRMTSVVAVAGAPVGPAPGSP